VGKRLHVPTALFVALLGAGLAAWSTYTMRSVFAANPVLIDEMAQLFHAMCLPAGAWRLPHPCRRPRS